MTIDPVADALVDEVAHCLASQRDAYVGFQFDPDQVFGLSRST